MANRILTAVSMVVLVFLLIAQLITIQRTNPPLKGDLAAPPHIKTLLTRACYDCHSNETRWPWYACIAPVSWLIVHDVERGRQELNFRNGDLTIPRREYESFNGWAGLYAKKTCRPGPIAYSIRAPASRSETRRYWNNGSRRK